LPVRVYECNRSEVEALKKVLNYDPYLDTNLIPSSKKDDRPIESLTEEERRQIEEKEKQISETQRKIAESPAGKVIFTRQEYQLKDGENLNLKKDTVYLYLSAPDVFLDNAEDRFKNEFKAIKRASKEEEETVITAIKQEEENANAGFGSIFGN